MRITLTTLTVGAGILTALLVGSSGVCHAQVAGNTDLSAVEASAPIPAESVPKAGIFYSAQYPNLPPVPGNFNSLPAWSLGNGVYLLDDVDSGSQAQSGIGMGAMDSGVPAPPGGWGDGGDGTNSPGGASSSYVIPTNGLYLTITGLSNGIVSLNLNNATDMVYEIWSTVSLTNPVWSIEQEVWALTNQTWTPFTVPVLDRTNSLFFYARDWTAVTSNGNDTPDWWFFWYFGTTAMSDTNLDADGIELKYDYINGTDPNIISFTVNATNRYFNTSSATLQTAVSAGVPSYMAAVVDSTNFSVANWMPYDSNLVVNLGSVEGWHSVWVGLRGLPPNAQQTWQQIQLKLLLTPPVLVITNPVPGIVTQPMIEVQGFCFQPLSSLAFDLSNAAGFFTNQQAFVLSQYYDPNAGGYTTNSFQAFDVPLTNGANVLTFYATDPAGNVTTTNFTYTLDYSGKTNPPAIQVFWPQNGDQVSGAEFTLRGSLDDFTASLTAQIIDASGDTNTLQGLVERNGLFWVENVPLLAGTNYVTLTAMDAVGNISTNNLTISVNAGLTIDDFSSELGGTPPNIIPVVTGTVALTNYTIWVNGVQAAQDGQGNWEADSVPLGPGGTAVVEARAIPDSDNNGNGTGSTPPTDGTPVNPTAADSMAAQTQRDQPAVWYMQDYHYTWTSAYTVIYNFPDCPVTSIDSYIGQVDHEYMTGGTADSYLVGSGSDCTGSSGACQNRAFSWPCDNCSVTEVYTDNVGDSITGPTSQLDALVWSEDYSFFQGAMPQAEWDLSENDAGQSISAGLTETYLNVDTESIYSTMTLQTGGKGIPGVQNLFEIGVSAVNFLSRWTDNGQITPDWNTTNVPYSQITVLGKTVGNDGILYTVLPDNATLDITPQAPPPRYTYSVSPSKIVPTLTANLYDLSQTNPTFCVGQQITFTLQGPSAYVNAVVNWNLPTKFVNHSWQATQSVPAPPGPPITEPYGSVNYDIDNSLLTYITTGAITTQCWYVNGQGGTVTVSVSYLFSNGQGASVAALGTFSIVTAKIVDMTNSCSGVNMFTNSSGSLTGIALSDTNNSQGMSITVFVKRPPQFGGKAFITQLFSRTSHWNVPIYIPWSFSTGGFCLDSQIPYQNAIIYLPLSAFRIPSNAPVRPLSFYDSPGLFAPPVGFYTYANIKDDFLDYVQFQPFEGNSIPVTIGLIYGRT